MSPFLSVGVCLALVVLVFFLTGLCLHNWKRFASGKGRGFWVIPGALLPDSPAKFIPQAAGADVALYGHTHAGQLSPAT